MSFDTGEIRSIQASGSAQATDSVRSASAQAPLAAAPSSDDDGAVAVDTFPATPPSEVMRAISGASNAYDQLQASGSRLHFAMNPATGRVSVEVHDLQGAVKSTIPGADALRIADGEAFH